MQLEKFLSGYKNVFQRQILTAASASILIASLAGCTSQESAELTKIKQDEA